MDESETLDRPLENPPQESAPSETPPDPVPAERKVPFFRVELTEEEINEVVATLRSGWLTTGPRARRFEQEFAKAVGGKHGVAVNSCTAALHLALEALDLRAGQAVLVPTMTFAATAEPVRHMGALPIFVDCDPSTLNMDLADAQRKLADLRAGRLPEPFHRDLEVAGMIPVHVGGLMMDPDAIRSFAKRHGLWVVEDAAHAFPAAWRSGADGPWQYCGQDTAAVTCFSFYPNKTITTGEGGMAVTDNLELAERMKLTSMHGLSRNAWQRYNGSGSWEYQIVAPGYKYNCNDIAATLGIHQLSHAEEMRCRREAIARSYLEAFADVPELEPPPNPADRIHSWHLFPIRLNLHRLSLDRNAFIDALGKHGIGCSVHWRPLHLHPYYCERFGWPPEQLPVASSQWQRLVSLPLFPGMREEEWQYVIQVVRELCRTHRVVNSGRPERLG